MEKYDWRFWKNLHQNGGVLERRVPTLTIRSFSLRQTTITGIREAIKRGRLRVLKMGRVSYICKRDVLSYQPRIDYQPGMFIRAPLPPGEDPNDWISVAEAARLRGVGQTAITTHATRGRIRSIKWGDTRLVHRQDILNFKRRPGAGRPKKK